MHFDLDNDLMILIHHGKLGTIWTKSQRLAIWVCVWQMMHLIALTESVWTYLLTYLPKWTGHVQVF